MGSMLLKKLNIAATLVDRRRKKREKERERERKRAFLENGGLVLEKLVACCNGRPIPIRTFSYQQLVLATSNFDHRFILYESYDEGIYKMYKGSFEGRILSIKVYDERESSAMDLALMDIGISAKASAHKNILKLVGCCLETSIPSLVFEYAQHGVLTDQIDVYKRRGAPMMWQSKLKIARQIAHAIAYLHTGFSRPIIHRDIRPQNILLDQHDVPKLSDFSVSISIPEGETHVETDDVHGVSGFLCPTYDRTNRVTEKTDVYSFGMVLLILLTGRHPDGTQGCEIVDPVILAEVGRAGLEQQLQAVRQLGFTCIKNNPEIRPTMVDVTKELRRIESSS